jgi:hypothetical protein
LEQYPDPVTMADAFTKSWIGDPVDDDVVISHGNSLMWDGTRYVAPPPRLVNHEHEIRMIQWALVSMIAVALAFITCRYKHHFHPQRCFNSSKKSQYEIIASHDV